MIDDTYGLSESDQLRIPTSVGYVDYPLTTLFDTTGGSLRAYANFGLPPVRFITQRGPFQDGETPLDMRLDPRVIQIDVAEYLCNRTAFWTRRNELLDVLRPSRAFSATGAYRPLVYRKRLPGGKPERGNDAVSDGAGQITTPWGRFVHWGGLQPGDAFRVRTTDYLVISVTNDYTVNVATAGGAVPAAGANLAWRYYRNRAHRDLNVLLEQGPNFDEAVGQYPHPARYREALRLVAHDPVWTGDLQSETWAIDAALGDLVFDLAGAWFGVTPGIGRWLFSTSFVGQTTSIVYWGTNPAKPTIVIAGPAVNPSITNSTVGVQLNLAYSVAAGETVTIDTLNLTAVNNAMTNLLPYLSGDLATFELTPSPQGATLPGYPDGRVNNVNVTFSGGVVGQSTATLYWNNRYIGI